MCIRDRINIDGVGIQGTFTSTDAVYTPATGALKLSVVNHGMQTGNRIKIADNSITFSCTKDGNATNHTYPRTTDPVSNQWLEVVVIDNNNIGVQVGASPADEQYVHTYVTSGGSNITRQDGTITINVLSSPPSSNTSAHPVSYTHLTLPTILIE